MTESSLKQVVQGLWAAREAKCLSIIECALSLLRAQDDLPSAEVDLNRRLFFCLLTASRALYPDELVAPISECNNQPDIDDDARACREIKRPDFQWIYLDRYEPDPHHSSKQFVLECKRIGMAVRRDRIFNVNYSDHGIRRFCNPKLGYGKHAPSGAMLGYWQSMNEVDLFREVNDACQTRSVPALFLVGSWNCEGITRFEHSLIRPFNVSPFKLYHLWVDVRA